MSILHDSPVRDESVRPTLASWPGGYGPTGPGGPGYWGPGGPGYWGPGGPGGPVRRSRRRLAFIALAALVAIAVAIGSYWGTKSARTAGFAASATGNRRLTTSQIAAKVDPGLVDIRTTLGYQNAAAAGTGIVLTSAGEVLTNNHVVEGAISISVTDIGNGQTYKAHVVGYDESADIAVIQLQRASGLQTAPLGSSSGVTVGEPVLGLGDAGGKGGTPSQASGDVTALGQSITASDESAGAAEQLTGLIQTNAAIQPGDSGGSLVSDTGQVVGLDTAASSGFQFQSSPQAQQEESFAIPINTARSVASQIEAGNSSSSVHVGATGFLGVELQSASGSGPGGGSPGSGYPGGGAAPGTGSGAFVAGVVPGGPAQQLGLIERDTITSLGGQAVTSAPDIQKIMNRYHPGDKVSVGWTDQYGQSQSGTLTLANGPVG